MEDHRWEEKRGVMGGEDERERQRKREHQQGKRRKHKGEGGWERR